MLLGLTVISMLSEGTALLVVSFDVAVIIAVPSEMPFTFPEESTVATLGSLLSQVTLLLVAFSGSIETESLIVLPTSTALIVLSIATPVTATGSCSVYDALSYS